MAAIEPDEMLRTTILAKLGAAEDKSQKKKVQLKK